MAIDVSCPDCGEEFRVRDEAAGKSFKCKVCGTTVRIPELDDEDEDDNPPARRRSRRDDDDEEDDRPRKRKRRSGGSGEKTLGPAIGLYVVAGLGLFGAIIRIALAFAQPDQFGMNPPPDMNEAARTGFFIGFFFATMGGVMLNVLVLAGAFCLHTRRAYSMALIGCLIATVPLCSPCCVLGMPFGIWGLVVLNDEGVKQSFG